MNKLLTGTITIIAKLKEAYLPEIEKNTMSHKSDLRYLDRNDIYQDQTIYIMN